MALVQLAFAVLLQGIKLARAHPGTWDGKVIMNENGAALPDLTGLWDDSSEADGTALVLQFYQPPDSPARPPNSTYGVRRGMDQPLLAVCTLSAEYDYDTRKQSHIACKCQSFEDNWLDRPLGVLSDDHRQFHFPEGRSWQRRAAGPDGVRAQLGRLTGMSVGAAKITKVHVIFMNHYDVGYTDFINGVDNTYMHKYFQLAAETAQKLRANGSDQFVYTTHPWLMDRFLNCPCTDSPCLATSLNNGFEKPLVCPSKEEVDNFTAAAQRGDIVWNGAPFNIQPENMAPELFQAGLDLVRRMDTRFGRNLTRTMSIRDVMYVTRAVLPLLKKNGINGLTVGSNGADYPPQVPKLHRWLDPDSKTDIMVAYHPYGYGGFGLKDCAESPNGVALCTEFRTDNTGPPSSVAEVQSTLDKVRAEYPGATVKPSTFDAFFADVLPVKDKLPVVTLEVADTWTYGNPSDPLKIAQYRAIQRAWISCLNDGVKECALSNPVVQNMTFFLLKAPEHTWGTPGISGWGQGGDYNSTAFRKNVFHEIYMKAAASWSEQRLFNDLAVRALEEGNHPLAAKVRNELDIVENVVAPNVADMHPVDVNSNVTMKSGWKVAFREDGAISSLQSPAGVDWASTSSPLGAFVYQTFNDTQWKPFTFSYLNDHAMQPGFCKPGSNNFTEGALWRPILKQLLVSGTPDSANFVLVVMEMPLKASRYYGAPRALYLNVTAAGHSVDLAFITVDKLPTMVGEATMVTFEPAPKLRPSGNGSAWRLDKLGQGIDPEAVQDGGNQFTHGVWNGANVDTTSGALQIHSLDAINFNPITKAFPVGNPLPASYLEADAISNTGMSRLAAGSVRGMAVNLHNNLWNTNYPLFYPYFDPRLCTSPLHCRNSNALWRFTLSFHPGRGASPPLTAVYI